MERVKRRWWTAAVTLVASVLVLGALLTGLFQVVMLMAPGYRQDLAEYVSRVARQPVDIGGVGLGWRGLAPRLDLTDITLYGEDGNNPALIADRLRLGFGLMRLLRGDTTPQRVELSGLALFARIDADGRFSLRGLDTAGGPARGRQEWLRQLGRFESVRLSRCELRLDDARLPGPDPLFRLREAEVRFADGRGQATAELSLPPEIGSTVGLEAQIEGDLEEPDTWKGRWQAQVDDLRSLPWLQTYLADDAQVVFDDTRLHLDGRVSGGALATIGVQLDAGAISGRRGELDTRLQNIEVQALLTPQANGWLLEMRRIALSGAHGAWPQSSARIRLLREPGAASRLQADAGYLRIGDLAPWAGLARGAAPERPLLQGLDGAVRGLVLRWDPADDGARYSLRADLDAVSMRGEDRRPGVAGLSGALSATEAGGRLSVVQAPLVIDYPHAFAAPVRLDGVDAEIEWTRLAADQGWQLQAPEVVATLLDGRAEGALSLRLPPQFDRAPQIDLDLRLSAQDVTRFKPYIPRFWPDPLRQWLDRAVVRGRIPDGRLRIKGDLAGFPFTDAPGTLVLNLDAAGGELAFAPDWPPLTDLAGRIEISGKGLSATATGGQIMGNRIEAGSARLESFRQADLRVEGEAEGEIARFYDYLRASPLAPRLADLLTRTAATGEAVVQLGLDVPLRDVKQTQARGQVRLRDARIDIVGVPEPVVGVYGDLRFDNRGAEAQELHGEVYNTQVLASIERDATDRMRLLGRFQFQPDASGKGVNRLLPRFLRSHLQGASQWRAELPLRGADSGRLSLASDLQGTAVSLPPPLQKAADEPWPTTLTVTTGAQFPLRLSLQVSDRLGADLAFLRQGDDRSPLLLERAHFRTGPGAQPDAEDYGIQVDGRAEELDPLRWLAAIKPPVKEGAGVDGSMAAAGALPLTVDLDVGRLWLGNLSSENLRLQHMPAAGGWSTRISGEGAQGNIDFRNDASGGVIEARLARAQIAWRARGNGAAEAAPKPPTTQRIDPAALPQVILRIDDLRVGEAELGALELRTERIDYGQRLAALRSAGPDGQFEAQGHWRRRDARSSAELNFDLQSKGVDDLLKGLGYAPSVSAHDSRFTAALTWPEQAPTAIQGLNWALARGRLDLDLEDGALRTVEPGAGRVLGLINFWAIPRRLNLDFGDVLSKGLSFDRMQGSFQIAEGVASTDDLDLDAPSLNMEVRGQVGLLARNYDQRVKVIPDVSAGVTLGALLLGGPAAGVLALIAQEVLDQPLDQVGQLRYHLTGSWDDPQVASVNRTASEPAVGGRPFNPQGTQ